MFHIFYIVKNTVNGKQYAGIHSTTDVNDGYLGSGKLVQQAISKYGRSKFVVTERKYFDTRHDAFAYEAGYITRELIESAEWYNLIPGGYCPPSPLGRKASPSTRRKMSECKIGENNGMYGKELTAEHRAKISDSLIGIKKPPRTKEHARNISIAKKGKPAAPCSPETKKKLSKANTGKQHTDATKQKLREFHRKHAPTKGVAKCVVTCPHCDKSGGQGAMQRWHFDNCKTRR